MHYFNEKSYQKVVCLEYISPYSKKTKQYDFDTNNLNLVHNIASNQAIVSDQIYKLCGSILSQRNIMKNRISETYLISFLNLKCFILILKILLCLLALLTFYAAKLS